MIRERLASWLVGASVRVLRPRFGEVVVVEGPVQPEDARRLAVALREIGVALAILPPGSRVSVEPRLVYREDRGAPKPKVTWTWGSR